MIRDLFASTPDAKVRGLVVGVLVLVVELGCGSLGGSRFRLFGQGDGLGGVLDVHIVAVNFGHSVCFSLSEYFLYYTPKRENMQAKDGKFC